MVNVFVVNEKCTRGDVIECNVTLDFDDEDTMQMLVSSVRCCVEAVEKGVPIVKAGKPCLLHIAAYNPKLGFFKWTPQGH